ncbi:MAG: glycosyltransferase [Verrucomicrobiota bacterium]
MQDSATRGAPRLHTVLITGDEPHYQAGLVAGLAGQNMDLDVIGNDALGAFPAMRLPGVRFHALRGTLPPGSSLPAKLRHLVSYYWKLAAFAARTDARLVHIQWPYKLVFLDRTLWIVYLKLLGKKVVFTAHNVDQGARDGMQSRRNAFSLRFLYRNVHRVIVHTAKMKTQLTSHYGVDESRVSVIPHGVNMAVAETAMTRDEARRRLNLSGDDRVLLAFGLISPYKGLDTLVSALESLHRSDTRVTAVVAGRVKECQDYWRGVEEQIRRAGLEKRVLTVLRHIPDEEVEVYFKAADALVMPYRNIFQSGVLFLAYRFGLPVIATDVGSFGEDIIAGRTGFVCRPEDAGDLAAKIGQYFDSDLYRDLDRLRPGIRAHAEERYSWDKIGAQTARLYAEVLDGKS